MKVLTLVTTVKLSKDGSHISTPPGVVDLDDETAEQLLARGQAKTLDEVKAEEAAASSGPSVKQQRK